MLRTIDNYYIIKELRADRYGERLFNVIQSTARLDTPSVPVLIETGTVGGSSRALFNIYKDRLRGYQVEQSQPIHSKVDRAYAFKEAILDGKIIICLDDYSRGELLEEMRGFPLMKHDDIIDACSYAYNYLSEKGSNVVSTGGKRHRRSLRL
jgi:phage terminase large subunit-like protein